MYSREFVASILELVGTNCPEVGGGQNTHLHMHIHMYIHM